MGYLLGQALFNMNVILLESIIDAIVYNQICHMRMVLIYSALLSVKKSNWIQKFIHPIHIVCVLSLFI